MDRYAQFLELWRFLFPSGYYIRLFELQQIKNSTRSQISKIQPFSSKQYSVAIQKTHCSLLSRPLFQTVMVSINYCSKIYWNTKQFYQLKYSNKNQITEKQVFCTKRIYVLLSKDQKNKFSHYISKIVVVSISLLDENIKILEI